jgi:predicted NACHT family NTPase
LDACRHHPRLVILGGPGSGKSSFLRALAIDLAKPLVGPGQHDGSRPAPVRFDRALLPVLVVVSEFAALLEPKNKEGKSIRAGDPGVQLAKFIKWSLERQNLGAAYEAIERQLRDGDAILLLDGLDEIAKPDLRAKVLAAIEAFADVHRQTRVMVTCRVAAYTMHEGGGSSTSTRDVPTNAGWSLPFPSVALADLNESQQEEFIKAWHLALEGVPDATERANALRRAVVRPDVQRLARVPLLLTLMAIVNDGVAPLPDQRTALYQMALDELLWKWRHGRRSRMSPADESPVQELLADVGRSTSDLEDRLRRIALAAHESVADKEQKDRTDITVAALSMELGSLCGDPLRRSQWTGNLIDVIRLRSGLIVETKPNVYDFSHQTFREYLAARALASSETNVQQAMELRTASNNHWREPILMMGGTFAHVMKLPELGASMVRALTSAACDERATAPRRRTNFDPPQFERQA